MIEDVKERVKVQSGYTAHRIRLCLSGWIHVKGIEVENFHPTLDVIISDHLI